MLNSSPKLQIYHWDFIFLIIGNLRKVPLHSHNAIQVFINTEGVQVVKVEGEKITAPVIYIEKNVEHEVLNSDISQFSILIDSDSIIAEHFSHQFLQGKQYSSDSQLLDYFDFESPQEFKQQLYDLLENDGCPICTPTDSRIQKAKELIDNDDEKKLSLKWLANHVYLSESRLAHLFKEEVGVPLRKYLLWKRLISALKIILNGNNLTQAAHQSGFSDSSHLSRTFKSNFGLNLSKIFKNSRIIQFHSL